MLISPSFVAQRLRLRLRLRLRCISSASCYSRPLHTPRKAARSFKRFRPSQPPPSRNLSLLEELFPKEVQRDGGRDSRFHNRTADVPRLPLPEVDDPSERFEHESDRGRVQPKRVSKIAAANAFRQQQLAVLSLGTASKSLIESDFRRIAPKGQHIDNWTGPGDILKIIPVRDPTTLEPAGRYFILFPNPAYARTYQNHVLRLHQFARKHTPTSIESPLPLQPGVVIEGEDAYTMLQDYSLCPPSQRIQLRILFPSYSVGIKQMLDHRGYLPLSGEMNKAGRSVLFSVDGQRLPTSMIRDTVAADGRDRGLAWDISIDRLDAPSCVTDGFEDPMITETDELADLSARHHIQSRWVMSFSSENEARSFVRAWHRRPFPSTQGDEPAIVEAQFIW